MTVSEHRRLSKNVTKRRLYWRNPELSRQKQIVRASNGRAAFHGVEGRLTVDDVKATVDGACCVYCGTTDRICIDHIVALSVGGPNTRENLQPCCRACNASKKKADRPGRWSQIADACVECARSDRRHNAGGLCVACYSRHYRRKVAT